MRLSSSCDSCALRRVKCEANRPCHECVTHSLVCTSTRTRKKRGPKGPRPSTRDRIERLQRHLSEQRENSDHSDACTNSPEGTQGSNNSEPGLGPSCRVPVPAGSPSPHRPGRIPLEAYCKYLNIFSAKLYLVWPVVSSSSLINTLRRDENDYEAWALAASLCAATIAQLRLLEHSNPDHACSSLQFVLDAQRLRESYEYRERFTVTSVLTPFFLHIYYANVDKLRTAGVYLRESITFLQALGLDQPNEYAAIEFKERSLQLRVFWLLFITERTYCAQNGFPVVLSVDKGMPPIEDKDGDSKGITRAFAGLTQIFAHLQGGITTSTSRDAPVMDSHNIIATQADLCVDRHSHVTSEVQQVDLFVTRQWIRLLIWEHTMRHFAMSCDSGDHAFSLLLPITIAHELLSLFSLVETGSIRAHGYGMELKVYRVADSLMDILACRPNQTQGSGMCGGLEDILYSLRNILLDMGGVTSVFLEKLQSRMVRSGLQSCPWPCLAIFGAGHIDSGGTDESGEAKEGQEQQMDSAELSDHRLALQWANANNFLVYEEEWDREVY